MQVAILGSGTYGSYIADILCKQYPDILITLFEVGDSNIKSEEEIGFYSSLKEEKYTGLTDGRWFGFGGSSRKWGGQLLTFTDNDFKDPDPFLADIIELNKKYKERVLDKFGIINNYSEKSLDNGLFTKTGVWLSYFGRDFYKHFKINKRKRIKSLSNVRVCRILNSANSATGIEYIQDNTKKIADFDYYFLTAGAFENARLLLNSNFLNTDKIYFSDHLSQKVFKIKNGTKIGSDDFVFRITGTSLITKRLIGEVNKVSFYAHPVLNTDFPFFQSLKTLLFKKQFSISAIINLFKNLPQAFLFVYYILIKRKMYVLNNEWYLYIDIENPTKDSYVELSKEHDKTGELGLDVHYSVDYRAEEIYNESKQIVKEYLLKSNTSFEECFDEINVQNSEDIYHPYNMYANFNSVEEYFNQFENMLIVSTGVLPRAGGINPTAAVLPVLEEFFQSYFNKKVQF